ncbi:MAG TPA: hypothetical protein DCW31_10025 [Lactobacillus sp.]|nr:hypothetical protein [Lactobacillus sp.]
MIDIQDSAQQLQKTVNDHFEYIQAGHDFARAFAIQFELTYTDFRMIELGLQLDGKGQATLLNSFKTAYQAVYRFEAPFAFGGLEEFDKQCRDMMVDYELAVKQLNKVLQQVLVISHVAA